MKKLEPAQYREVLSRIDPAGCGAVYPYSVAEGLQTGEIWADDRSVLIWHYCGFAFPFGDTAELHAWIYRQFLSEEAELPRRFLLFVSEQRAADYAGKPGLLAEERCFFTHPGAQKHPPLTQDEQAGIREIDRELLGRLTGRITPPFSWSSPPQFLQNGKGFCVMRDGIPASCAFSAAVSHNELDIGIETDPQYRKQGLARLAAQAMIEYAAAQNKTPVWACHAQNGASRSLAEKLGFVQTDTCITIRKG